MQIKTFLTTYTSFEDLETVQRTLPSVVEETLRCDAALVIHDSSVEQREEIRTFIAQFESDSVFTIFSSPISQAGARNMALDVGLRLFAPEYIASIEDDHGYNAGFIPAIIKNMVEHYGEEAPNGMRYGMFSGCRVCWEDYANYGRDANDNLYPRRDPKNRQQHFTHWGGVNACCYCAPLRHWQTVLGRFDPDEYPISYFQPGAMNIRNYQNGFTGMTIAGGELMFCVDRKGRGHSVQEEERPFVAGMSKRDRLARQQGKN